MFFKNVFNSANICNLINFLYSNLNNIRALDSNFYFKFYFYNKNYNKNYYKKLKLNKNYIFHDTRALYSFNNDFNSNHFKNNKKYNTIFIFIKGSKFNPYNEFQKIYEKSDILILNFNESLVFNDRKYENFFEFFNKNYNLNILNYEIDYSSKIISFSDTLKYENIIHKNKNIKDKKKFNKIFINTNNSKLLYNFILKFINKSLDENLFFIGITGTDGKTSAVNVSRQFFNFNNKSASCIGTLGVNNNGQNINFSFSTPTSPEIWDLYQILNNIKRTKNIFMEVTSIGSVTYRFHSISFDGLVFTNMTSDHLDFHGTLENYYNAKLKIIDILNISSKKDKFILSNIDDENFYLVKDYAEKFSNIKFFSYGYKKEANFYIEKFKSNRGISEYLIRINACNINKNIRIKTNLIGKFNGYNLLIAIALYFLKYKKIPKIDNKTLKFFINGRLQKISFGTNDIYIDYAHTSKSLYSTINVLKDENYEKIITIFGCGGNRDKSKRPEMGKIAYENSSLVIITSDNPRNEEPLFIINDILEGIEKEAFKINGEKILLNIENYYFDEELINQQILVKLKNNEKVVIIEPDRRKAILIGFYILKKLNYSTLLITGKGHEDYQEIKGKKIHFSDYEEALNAIKLFNKNLEIFL